MPRGRGPQRARHRGKAAGRAKRSSPQPWGGTIATEAQGPGTAEERQGGGSLSLASKCGAAHW
eukprot:760204-Rhodomonas_salina.1